MLGKSVTMILRRLTTLYHLGTCYLACNETKGWLRTVVCVTGSGWLVGTGKETREIFQNSTSKAGIQTRNLPVVSVFLERVGESHVVWYTLYAAVIVYSAVVTSNTKKYA